MKRLLLTLLCVLFAYPCFAAEPIQLARMSPWVAGSVAAESGVIGSTVTSSTYLVSINMRFSPFTTTTAGTVSYAHIYISTGPVSDTAVCLSIHGLDLATKASGNGTITASTTGWVNIPLESSTTIDAGIVYLLSLQGSGTSFSVGSGEYTASFDCDDPNKGTCLATASYSCGQNIPGGATASTGRPLAIIFNNTSGAP